MTAVTDSCVGEVKKIGRRVPILIDPQTGKAICLKPDTGKE